MKKTHEEILREHDISPSFTRVMIYKYIEKNNSHPSVDEVFNAIKNKLPTLSKTTVYNVLKLFIDKNLIKGILIGSQDMKYEVVGEKHSHFKCEICNIVYDIPLVSTDFNVDTLKGFKVKEREVLFTGICPDCSKSH